MDVLHALVGVLGAWVLTGSAAGATPAPRVEFKDLYAAVQTSGIFADSKTFADAVPQEPPAAILSQFHAQHPQSPQALRRFVQHYFNVPDSAVPDNPETAPAARPPLGAHIDALWAQLERDTPAVPPYSSALALPKPYVVPGGRFRELYYWDSYFTLLGLAQSGRDDLVQDMIGDFGGLIDTYGHVPNGTRTYYLSRSQPPFFFEIVAVAQSQDRAAALGAIPAAVAARICLLDGGCRNAQRTRGEPARGEAPGRRSVEPVLGRCRPAAR